MEILWVVLALIAAAAAAIGFSLRSRGIPPQPSEKLPEVGVKIEFEARTWSVDSGPDNPKYSTWEEAMNRPVTDSLLFRISYADRNGEITEREIVPLAIHLTAHRPEVRIRAKCLLRNAERDFMSDRIITSVNMRTGRKISDLGQYLRAKY